MSDSLQDQLKALGLAKSKPKKKPGKSHRKPGGKSGRKAGKPSDPASVSLQEAYALRAREEKQKADRARRRKQAEDRKRAEINKAIKAIVDEHRLNDSEAELTRNFLFKGRIRKVNVTAEQLAALNSEALGVVYLTGSYYLLEPEWVEKVRALSTDHVPDLSANTSDDDSAGEDEFPVPDDLTW